RTRRCRRRPAPPSPCRPAGCAWTARSRPAPPTSRAWRERPPSPSAAGPPARSSPGGPCAAGAARPGTTPRAETPGTGTAAGAAIRRSASGAPPPAPTRRGSHGQLGILRRLGLLRVLELLGVDPQAVLVDPHVGPADVGLVPGHEGATARQELLDLGRRRLLRDADLLAAVRHRAGPEERAPRTPGGLLVGSRLALHRDGVDLLQHAQTRVV